MHSSIRIGIVSISIGLGVGVSAGLLTASSHAKPVPATAAFAAPPEPAAPAVAQLDDGDRATLQAIMGRLAALHPGQPASPPPAPASPRASDAPPTEIAPTSPEAVRAFDSARAEVDEGIARGTWSAADRAQIHENLAYLPAETRVAVERPLVVAVNTGSVHVEGRGPLF